MVKFIDVDIIYCLKQIVKKNTVFFQTDFEIDKIIFKEYAESDNSEDKYWLWMARFHGTHCLRERDVFIKDTAEHNAWIYYEDSKSQHILSYAVEITGVYDGVIRGNIYSLNYKKHCQLVKQSALPILGMRYVFDFGEYRSADQQYMQATVDKHQDLGKLKYVEAFTSQDDSGLKALLSALREPLRWMKPGNFEDYIKKIKQMIG